MKSGKQVPVDLDLYLKNLPQRKPCKKHVYFKKGKADLITVHQEGKLVCSYLSCRKCDFMLDVTAPIKKPKVPYKIRPLTRTR